MEQTIKFQSSKEHYIADVCVVWCFDDRFTPLMEKFFKQFPHADLVKVAGGAKVLAGGPSPEREFVAGQVKASIRLHATKRIALMVHRDCGAYGGSKSFSDAAAEQEHHVSQLRAACDFLKGEAPGVLIDTYFADFDGLYRVA